MCKENNGIILHLQASMGTDLPKTGQAETGLKQCRSPRARNNFWRVSWCLFQVRIVNNSSRCISPRISDQSCAIHSDSLHTDDNWNNWTARSDMTGQHDPQDKRLTGQLPNQSGHCPLTGHYFEPWSHATKCGPYTIPQPMADKQRSKAVL